MTRQEIAQKLVFVMKTIRSLSLRPSEAPKLARKTLFESDSTHRNSPIQNRL